MYRLLPSTDDSRLFFALGGEEARRYGAVGYLRVDFGRNGREFQHTWFDLQPNLKSPSFKYGLGAVIDSLRNDGQAPIFAGRMNLERFCSAMPGKEIPGRGQGYVIRTPEYSYFFRCLPRPVDYDVYCFCYINRLLLPELEKAEGSVHLPYL